MRCIIVGTWPFSQEAVKVAANIIKENRCGINNDISIDAVEKGINRIECDADYGLYLVGRGGVRNNNGELELDAGIMCGRNLNYGGVTALQGIDRAISVARKVMEESSHCVLTGSGAQQFAVKQGFLLDKHLLERQLPEKLSLTGHDTLGLICLFGDNITAGVSTSGKGGKEAGRVGDSATAGSGLYADSDGGAACCSGDGDEIIKHCPAFRVVHYMKMGETAQAACDKVIKEITGRLEHRIELVIIAVDMKRNIGAGSTLSTWTDPKSNHQIAGFPYVVWEEDMLEPELRIKG